MLQAARWSTERERQAGGDTRDEREVSDRAVGDDPLASRTQLSVALRSARFLPAFSWCHAVDWPAAAVISAGFALPLLAPCS